MNYTYLPDFVYRTPYMAIGSLNSTDFYNNCYFQEAIYIASPDLYAIMMQNKENMPHDLFLSLLKYAIRMQCRCTPFGLFTACGTGSLGTTSNITINQSDFYTSTRLDMSYACHLAEFISRNRELQYNSVWQVNNSLYKIGNRYRYVEYKTTGDGVRQYFLSEVQRSKILDTIIASVSKKAMHKEQVATVITGYGIDHADAMDYIDSLVQNQILTSPIIPSAVGERDVLGKITSGLRRLTTQTAALVQVLESVQNKLAEIDNSPAGNRVPLYNAIANEAQKIQVPFSRKHLLQVDLSTRSAGTLKKEIFDAALDGFQALIQLTANSQNEDLKKFKIDFIRRYDAEEVPLSQALDPEISIGFGKYKAGNVSLDRFTEGMAVFDSGHSEKITENDSPAQQLLIKKYVDYVKNEASEIVFTEQEIMELPDNRYEFPDTLSAMIEVIHAGNRLAPLIKMVGVSGSSAGNLLGRFCHNYDKINGLVEEIVHMEEDIAGEDHVLAEVVHIPEARMGNILYRPSLRKYEIPYLSTSSVAEEYQIPVSDLYVSVRKNKIVLRSARLNKYVRPRLTTAHNYFSRTLPVYNFLCAVQNDLVHNTPSFVWGPFFAKHTYRPRVRYKNVILSPAQWFFKYADDIQALIKKNNSDKLKGIEEWRQLHKVPAEVLLGDADNKLLINLEDPIHVKLFLSEIKSGNKIRLQEYLSPGADPLVLNGKGYHTNQVIFSFVKTKNS